MLNRSPRSSIAALLALTLFITGILPTAAFAQKKDEKKDEKKDASQQQPKLTKDERTYQKIKKFSLDLYSKDEDFRQDVDEAYRQKQREHSEFAYYTNTRDGNDDQFTRTGDKLKVDDTLYDNPLAQDYVNRVGQSLVPSGTPHRYGFKITLNPIPESRSLSTGTIYVSSGLLSQIDNEAQLAYVLGHEIAHVEEEHWKEDVLVAQGAQEYNEKQQKKRARLGLLIGIASAAVGAGFGGADAGFASWHIATQLAPSILKLAVRDVAVSWDRLQEDEADQLGLKYMLDRNYDVTEVPKFYATLGRLAQRDPRARLGFIADQERIKERVEVINITIATVGNTRVMTVGATNLANREPDTGKTLDPMRDSAGRAAAAERAISGTLSAEIKAKLDAGELIGSSAEFESVMAGLKRDNGVRAFYYDMFHMARENLEDSIRIRSNDPYAHYYYGKVLKLTARTATEKSRALSEFVKAIELDKRRVVPESHLYRALSLIEMKDPGQTREIISSLKEYVSLYQREHMGDLPPDMDAIYDYMQEAGEMTWAASPARNVSTKNIEPIGVSTSAGARSVTPAQATPTPPPAEPQPPPVKGKGRKP